MRKVFWEGNTWQKYIVGKILNKKYKIKSKEVSLSLQKHQKNLEITRLGGRVELAERVLGTDEEGKVSCVTAIQSTS